MSDDQDLMDRVAKGENSAIEELYDRFGSLVFRMAYQMMPTKAEAEDAVQEIFIRLWKSADRYSRKKAALITWVMLISRRHLVDRLRRKRVRPQSTTFDETWSSADKNPSSSGERSMLLDEREKRLRERIEKLPDLQREVVQRAYLGGRTLREISLELDRPIGTIKSALSRALASLRQRISEDEGLL